MDLHLRKRLVAFALTMLSALGLTLVAAPASSASVALAEGSCGGLTVQILWVGPDYAAVSYTQYTFGSAIDDISVLIDGAWDGDLPGSESYRDSASFVGSYSYSGRADIGYNNENVTRIVVEADSYVNLEDGTRCSDHGYAIAYV